MQNFGCMEILCSKKEEVVGCFYLCFIVIYSLFWTGTGTLLTWSYTFCMGHMLRQTVNSCFLYIHVNISSLDPSPLYLWQSSHGSRKHYTQLVCICIFREVKKIIIVFCAPFTEDTLDTVYTYIEKKNTAWCSTPDHLIW